MKKILCLFTLFAYFSGYSQDYYSGDTAYGSDVIYKVTSWGNNFGRIISNINNTKVRTQPLLKNGSEVNPGYIKVVKSNDIDGAILKKSSQRLSPQAKSPNGKKRKQRCYCLKSSLTRTEESQKSVFLFLIIQFF